MAREAVRPEQVLHVWRRVLERRLRARLAAEVSLSIHDNTHTMVTYQRRRGAWHLRLHHMFLASPDEVVVALAQYVQKGDAESSAVLDVFIEQNKPYIRKLPPSELRRRLRIVPSGRTHDLQSLFEKLNAKYFDNRVNATITYGPAPRMRGPRKSIKMGSYSADSKVIRIHPVLDRPEVPRYFVEWIVFHEMLHHVHPAKKLQDGRRSVHTPEFLAHERQFHAFTRASAWENDNLEFLLTARVAA